MTDAQKEALSLSAGLPMTAANLERVGRLVSPEVARWAFGQWSLRKRARTKFKKGDEMLFDPDGFEMATHEAVAAFHAGLFPVGAKVVDVTCGIGADLIALANRGPALGFDLAEPRVEMARENLRVHGVEAEVSVGDALSVPLGDYAFADPSRRPDGRRTLDLTKFQPDLSILAKRFQETELTVIKLSPMLSDSDLDLISPHRIFVSFGHECREVLMLLGRLASGGVRAHHVESGLFLSGGTEPPYQAEDLQTYLWEADPAAIRAHALGDFDAFAVGDSNGYLTAETPAQGPWMRSYRVIGSGAFDPKRLMAILRDVDSATPVLKQRGAGLDLIVLQKKFRLSGTRPTSVAFWRSGPGIRFAILDPAG